LPLLRFAKPALDIFCQQNFKTSTRWHRTAYIVYHLLDFTRLIICVNGRNWALLERAVTFSLQDSVSNK